MYETFSTERKPSEKTSAGKLVTPEYREILRNLGAYQRLFQYRYLENVASLSKLCELVGCKDVEEVVALERNLDAYFRRAMGGTVRGDLLALVCPNCFQLTLTNYAGNGETIQKTCSNCGVESGDSVFDGEEFTQFLDRDVTYAPESLASSSKGLGNSFDPNRNRDHNHFLWQMLNASNVLWKEFKHDFPEIAEALKDSYLVEKNGYIFCRVGDFVRNAKVGEFFTHIDQFFHSYDAPLKNKKVRLEIRTKSSLKRALEYGLKLCEKYGFNRKDKDQAIYNTVGHEIRSIKRQLKTQHRHVPEKRLVETIFYICLLRFDKNGVAVRARSELDINFALVNYYADYKEFLRTHDKLNGSKLLLSAVEQANIERKIS